MAKRAGVRARPLALVALGAVILAAFGLVGAEIVNQGLEGCQPHLRLQFGGSAGCGVDEGQFHKSLWLDTGFALAYGLFLTVAAWKLPKQRHLDPRLSFLDTLALSGPAVAACSDGLENLLLGRATSHTAGGIKIEDGWTEAVVTALATAKWALLFLTVAVLLLRLANWRPEREQGGPEPWSSEPGGEDDLALCCSGGGIRSAAFSLGVLREVDRSPVMERVGMIAAVSGGNYAATGWLLQRAAGDGNPADQVIDGLVGQTERSPFRDTDARRVPEVGATEKSDTSPSSTTSSRATTSSEFRRRTAEGLHRFLANGPGGLSRAVFWAAAAVAANLLQLLVVIVAAGWPLGRLETAHGFHPELVTALHADPRAFDVTSVHLYVSIMLVVTALVLASLPALPKLDRYKPTKALQGAAKALFVLAGVWLFVIAVGPWTLVQFSDLGGKETFQIGGGVSVVATLGGLARTFRDPLQRIAPRLGGIALVILIVLILGKVVRDSAVGNGIFHSGDIWIGCVAASLLLAYGIDTQTWSLREMYRARLANSFVVQESRPTRLWDRLVGRDRGIGKPWSKLEEDGELPELIVCCAASRVGLSPEGAPAESFTVSQRQVSHHRASGSVAMATSTYIAALNSWATKPLRSPAGWLATSGAAFASAMGRSSVGSTNALMAALNVDLGIWLPTLETLSKNRDIPPVGLGHLANEIVGLYSERGETIFVADGGHLENLGLVELLRNGRRQIVCIDASGDEPGSFSTLRAALRVADTTLADDRRLRFDLRELDASSIPARKSVYRIQFATWDQPLREIGVIYYLKLQPSMDQSLELRQFANADPKFPNYSTTNQLLDDQQFRFLVLAGAEAGKRLCGMLTSAQTTDD